MEQGVTRASDPEPMLHMNLPFIEKQRTRYCLITVFCFVPNRNIEYLHIIVEVMNYPLCFGWFRCSVAAIGLSTGRWKSWVCDSHFIFSNHSRGRLLVWSVTEQQ